MALARVVSFEGVSKQRMDELQRGMGDGGGPPEGFPPAEFVALHDPETEKSLTIFFFETEEDFARADEILNAMPAGDTPGQRTSVTRYDVVFRMKS
jgi:hypothetical protein